MKSIQWFSCAFFVCGMVPQLLWAAFSGDPNVGKYGDRNASLNFYIDDYPNTLNPIIHTMGAEANISEHFTIFESLLETDPDTGEVSCWLCSSFEYAKDNLSVLLTLRKNIVFHDGKPLTARDILFSYQVTIHPKVDNFNFKNLYLDVVDRVEQVDEYTVRFWFKRVAYAKLSRKSKSQV